MVLPISFPRFQVFFNLFFCSFLFGGSVSPGPSPLPIAPDGAPPPCYHGLASPPSSRHCAATGGASTPLLQTLWSWCAPRRQETATRRQASSWAPTGWVHLFCQKTVKRKARKKCSHPVRFLYKTVCYVHLGGALGGGVLPCNCSRVTYSELSVVGCGARVFLRFCGVPIIGFTNS